MTWIESHVALGQHPKTRRLRRQLGLSTPTAVGHLHLLWWWAMQYAPEGDLTDYSDDDIADAVEWDGDAAVFVEALTAAGFLNPDRTIHDWQDYVGKLLEKRRADADRKRQARGLPLQSDGPPAPSGGRPVDGARTSADVPQTAPPVQRTAHVTVTSTGTGPDRTGPPTGPRTPLEANVRSARGTAAAAAVCVPAEEPTEDALPDPVKWVWDFYLSEIQPEARVCPTRQILARLETFTVDELTVGIQNFRDDAWCMDHNRTRGGGWFFKSDERSQQFLTMEPRAAPLRVAGGVFG